MFRHSARVRFLFLSYLDRTFPGEREITSWTLGGQLAIDICEEYASCVLSIEWILLKKRESAGSPCSSSLGDSIVGESAVNARISMRIRAERDSEVHQFTEMQRRRSRGKFPFSRVLPCSLPVYTCATETCREISIPISRDALVHAPPTITRKCHQHWPFASSIKLLDDWRPLSRRAPKREQSKFALDSRVSSRPFAIAHMPSRSAITRVASNREKASSGITIVITIESPVRCAKISRCHRRLHRCTCRTRAFPLFKSVTTRIALEWLARFERITITYHDVVVSILSRCDTCIVYQVWTRLDHKAALR